MYFLKKKSIACPHISSQKIKNKKQLSCSQKMKKMRDYKNNVIAAMKPKTNYVQIAAKNHETGKK